VQLIRRRKDNPSEHTKATIPVPQVGAMYLPPDLKTAVLPRIASEPTQVCIPCPRCGNETTARVKREYTPIPESFRPFYERALKGDLKALVEYYEKSWWRADLGSAFYQCLGYLAARGLTEHIKVARRVQTINKSRRGASIQGAAKRAIYEYWKKVFIRPDRAKWEQMFNEKMVDRPAYDIRDWLRERRQILRASGKTKSRENLWDEYASENLPLLNRAAVDKDPYHKNIKQLLFLLAQAQPRLSPAQAVRIVACGIACISVSSVSHKKRAQTKHRDLRMKKIAFGRPHAHKNATSKKPRITKPA
jgi:hypothetical protein